MKIAKFEFSLFGINTYVVYDPESKECAVIDPGMINEEEIEAVENFIKREGLHLTQIINTHLHIDHAIGIDSLKRNHEVKVAAHPADRALGERLLQQARSFGLPFSPKNVVADIDLKDGDVIRIGNGSLRVLHTPGHSQGGICLYDATDDFLISGDTLFAGSVGRTDLPGGDMSQLISGIKEKLLTLPPQTVVYPGHGPATTIAREKASNPFLM